MKYIAILCLALIAIFLCLALILIPEVVRQNLTLLVEWFTVFAQIAFAILSIALCISVLYGAWAGLERVLTIHAERNKMQREIITAPAGHGVWLREASGQIRNLSLDARVLIVSTDGATQDEMRAWSFFQSLHSTRHAQVGAHEAKLLNAPQAVDLLTHMQQVRRALIVGNSEAGKTTLLKHVIAQRLPGSHVVVLDPHAGPDTWPCEVIGRGSDHAQIERALDGFLALMIKRYREIGAGQNGHSRVTLVVDEWLSIVGECQNASRVIVRLICEARKASIDVFVGSHSERVASLGLSGKGDLKEGLEIIRLHYNQWTGERDATIQIGSETIPAILPGVFQNDVWAVEKSELLLPAAEPSAEEARILSMSREGASLKQISEAVWSKFGGAYNEKIREVVEKWSMNLGK